MSCISPMAPLLEDEVKTLHVQIISSVRAPLRTLCFCACLGMLAEVVRRRCVQLCPVCCAASQGSGCHLESYCASCAPPGGRHPSPRRGHPLLGNCGSDLHSAAPPHRGAAPETGNCLGAHDASLLRKEETSRRAE